MLFTFLFTLTTFEFFLLLCCFYYCKVWEESSGESLLQIQLLVALRNFVVALGYQSPICYNILLPILENGIDINSPDELNLLEDSMLVILLSIFNQLEVLFCEIM